MPAPATKIDVGRIQRRIVWSARYPNSGWAIDDVTLAASTMVVANGGAAAVARAAGFESAMTQQWYTNAATETSRPMKIRALGHVSLFVRDLEATRRFYRDLLGLAETGSGKDGRIIFFSAG